MSYAYTVLTVSPAAYEEIYKRLRAAGFDAATEDGALDMHGLALRAETAHRPGCSLDLNHIGPCMMVAGLLYVPCPDCR